MCGRRQYRLNRDLGAAHRQSHSVATDRFQCGRRVADWDRARWPEVERESRKRRGELGSAVQLRGWCWNSEVIKAGDTVSMKGRRLKNGSPYMTLSEEARVTNAAGKDIYKGNDPGKPGEPGPCAPARTQP